MGAENTGEGALASSLLTLGTLSTAPPASDSRPPKRYRDIWIASNVNHARHLRHSLGCRPSGNHRDDPCLVTFPGGQICGLRFHNVILGRATHEAIYADQRLREWFEDHIRTRMWPDSAIIDL
jgi:hypothetical protein